MQMAALGVSVGIAISSGLLAGFIASRPIFRAPSVLFDDRDNMVGVKYPKLNGNTVSDSEFEHPEKKSLVPDVLVNE